MSQVDPAQIVKILVEALGLTAKVGALSNDDQQSGAVSIMAAGMPQVQLYAPLISMRAQFRCVGPTLIRANEMALTIQLGLPSGRQIVQQADGDKYLVHMVTIDSGPSMHFDSEETQETLIFGDVTIGSVPVETAD